MGSLFLLLGCNLSYIDLFAALHELVSASAHTLLKLASSVHALLKPYGDTLNLLFRDVLVAVAVVFCVRSLITNKNDVSRDVTTGHVGLFISEVGKNTTWVNVSY